MRVLYHSTVIHRKVHVQVHVVMQTIGSGRNRSNRDAKANHQKQIETSRIVERNSFRNKHFRSIDTGCQNNI